MGGTIHGAGGFGWMVSMVPEFVTGIVSDSDFYPLLVLNQGFRRILHRKRTYFIMKCFFDLNCLCLKV